MVNLTGLSGARVLATRMVIDDGKVRYVLVTVHARCDYQLTKTEVWVAHVHALAEEC